MTVLLPYELTAENGAKRLLSGEFFVEVNHSCSVCIHDVEPNKECEECGGRVDWVQKHCIPWPIIKDIYRGIVKHLKQVPPSEPLSWDEYFLQISKTVALKSKDKSSKVGAVIVGPDHEIRSTGFNGLPRGMDDNDPEKQDRPAKYKFFEHAERNAIYNAARFGAETKGCTMYCVWPPCSDCARAIVQAGIVRLVTSVNLGECPRRWIDDMMIAADILRSCGVVSKVNW